MLCLNWKFSFFCLPFSPLISHWFSPSTIVYVQCTSLTNIYRSKHLMWLEMTEFLIVIFFFSMVFGHVHQISSQIPFSCSNCFILLQTNRSFWRKKTEAEAIDYRYIFNTYKCEMKRNICIGYDRVFCAKKRYKETNYSLDDSFVGFFHSFLFCFCFYCCWSIKYIISYPPVHHPLPE